MKYTNNLMVFTNFLILKHEKTTMVLFLAVLINYLLQAGFGLEARSPGGQTPLHSAARDGMWDCYCMSKNSYPFLCSLDIDI